MTLLTRAPRRLALVGLLAATIVAFVAPTSGQGTAAKKPVPRLPFGQPDLQGVWSFAMLTPLERPDELKGKEVLTEKEAVEYQNVLLKAFDHDTAEGAERACKGTGNYNEFWYDRGNTVAKTRRTSLIVDPPDGKIPALTPDGEKRRRQREAYRASRGPADSWTDRGVGERCIVGFNAGPPMMPSAYNNNVQIFQTKGPVVLLNEMVNDSRIIPVDGRPHLPAHIRQWRGDSRGRWEGNTLVIDTTNFRDESNFRNATANLHLVERLTRVDANTLMYEFTVEDSNTWTRPWSVAVPMTKTEGPIYEYACHEGNYGMFNLLAGARAEEKDAGEAAGKK